MTTTARRMFITGPMMRIWNRSHFVSRQEFVGTARAGVVGILARHLHVAAERNRADAVLGVATSDLQQLRAEAERERQHADAEPARRQEVTELVHEHEHAKDEQECEERVHCAQF